MRAITLRKRRIRALSPQDHCVTVHTQLANIGAISMTTQVNTQGMSPAAKRLAVLAAAAGLSTWAIDMAATQVGLVSQQAALGISVTASHSTP